MVRGGGRRLASAIAALALESVVAVYGLALCRRCGVPQCTVWVRVSVYGFALEASGANSWRRNPRAWNLGTESWSQRLSAQKFVYFRSACQVLAASCCDEHGVSGPAEPVRTRLHAASGRARQHPGPGSIEQSPAEPTRTRSQATPGRVWQNPGPGSLQQSPAGPGSAAARGTALTQGRAASSRA